MSDYPDSLDQQTLFAIQDGFRLEEFCDDFTSLRFLDLESTGLTVGSLPIEFGVCGLDLKPRSFLINCAPDTLSKEWSLDAEMLHKISITEIRMNGLDRAEAIDRAWQELVDTVVISDNAEHDQAWLSMLSREFDKIAVLPSQLFYAKEKTEAETRSGETEVFQAIRRIREMYPHLHRASPDSLRLAAEFKVLLDGDFLHELLKV